MVKNSSSANSYTLQSGYPHCTSLGTSFAKVLVMILVLSLGACGTVDKTSRSDFPSDFTNQQLEVTPDVRIFHYSPDSSRIYIALNTKNLLYTKINSESFSASVQVTITPQVKGQTEEKGTGKIITMTDEDAARKGKRIMGETVIELKEGSEYNIRFDIMDANTGKQTRIYRRSNKTDPRYRDYFLVKEKGSVIPLFNDRIHPSGDYTIQVAGWAKGKLYVNYYDDDFPLPLPPFTQFEPKPFDYDPTTKFELGLDKKNTTEFQGVRLGFYHFRIDTTSKEGLTLFTTSEEFPEVTTDADLLGPIRYLLSGKEYEALMNAANPKAAMERHWLEWSGTKDRARRNLTAFYTRVEEANRHFSSHVDGWKSDRGLIYIVYGKPNKVYSYEDLETWIYGEENNPLSITFHFVKVINPFTDNDYRLERNERYKPSWYRAIDTWRSGRTF